VKDLRTDDTRPRRADKRPTQRDTVLRITHFHHHFLRHLIKDVCDVALHVDRRRFASFHKWVDLSISQHISTD